MKFVLSLLMALAAVPAHAQLYKWTDASGKVHYSDRPQDGANTKELRVQQPAAAAPVNDNWKQRESEFRDRQVGRERAERLADEAAAREAAKPLYNPSAHRSDKPMTDDEVCTRDAQQIAFSEKAKQLAFTGRNGSVTVSEKERQEIVRQRKENHTLICGPGQRRR